MDDELPPIDETDSIEDKAKVIFSKHGKSVFCVAPHPVEDSDLVASGGEDDLAYIWKRGSGGEDDLAYIWKRG